MSSLALAAASAVAALALPQPQLSFSNRQQVDGNAIGNRIDGDLLAGTVTVTPAQQNPGVAVVSAAPGSLQAAQDLAAAVGSPNPVRVSFLGVTGRTGVWRAIGGGRFQQENKAGNLIRGKTFKPTPADLAGAVEVKSQQAA